ncbi:Ribonuclease BN [Acidisarcina polymorpha]|uniref:Ribonuclease BN n=1 Tax=Acidisarcina polymorpha TaxID=2211140 RepID=A0A2Z5FVA8_9BACT|nr:YihY/virulence factor BrkB family protein [Acidisarcina polymorpha]AXC10434.1 Ribonuclease BN [Acidisarcina polymorpha]
MLRRSSVRSATRKFELRSFALGVWQEMFRTRSFVVAAALSFYFLLSLVPLLIVFSSLLSYLPIPNIFDQLLDLMATVVPPDAMALVQKIVISVLSPHARGLLSFGVLGYLWSSTGGYSAVIEALDIAYGVRDSRPWWRDRLQALLLTFTTGALFTTSLILLILGSDFGHMVEAVFPTPDSFGRMWPAIRLALTFTTFLAAVLVMYVFGPNARITFRSALPGAVLAVFGWFLGSFGFTFYLKHFADYDVTYGSLGAVIVLMLWFYIIAVAMLLGAEVNAQLARRKQIQQAVTEQAGHVSGVAAT